MVKKEMIQITTTVGDAVDLAFGVVNELADEMQEAFDNTPESLQQSGVGEARGECADALANISQPDVPDCARDLKVEFHVPPSPKRLSRAGRRDEGLRYAYEAINGMELRKAEIEDDDGFSDELQEIEVCIEEVQTMIDEAEDVSFPGMYG